MGKIKKRYLVAIAISIILPMIWTPLIILSIPIIIIMFIDNTICCKINKKNENEQKEQKIPIENCEIDTYNAIVEKINKRKEEEKEFRKNVDLRQFRNRKDVTIKEVEDYLWYHQLWEGFENKLIILEEITKVCNITEKDCKEIIHNHYNHKGMDGSIGGGHWIRNEETKKEIEYENMKYNKLKKEINNEIRKMDEEIIRNSCPEVIKTTMEINEIIEKNKDKKIENKMEYIYEYEKWLKDKGYI